MNKFKFLLIILLTFFIGINSISADTNTFERTKENNYGVNKKWIIDSSNINNVKNTLYVDASLKVYDYADILTEQEEYLLTGKILKFIEKYNTDLVLLTDSFGYYYDEANEEYAVDFYDYNDFGLDYPKYDGILLFRNANPNDRYYDIYTFGNAQLYFNQSRYDYILDSIYNYFVNQDYYQGYSLFLQILDNYYAEGKPASMGSYDVDDMGYLYEKYVPPILPAFIISSVVTLVVMLILVSKNKMVKKATKASEYMDHNSVFYTRQDDNFIRSHTRSYTTSSSSGGSIGGGGRSSSRSGSSGGGHSRGGGRHG